MYTFYFFNIILISYYYFNYIINLTNNLTIEPITRPQFNNYVFWYSCIRHLPKVKGQSHPKEGILHVRWNFSEKEASA